MEVVYIKILLSINVFVCVQGAPLAMLQHATSSQSIIFHQGQIKPTPSTIPTSSPIDVHNVRQTQPKYEYKYEVSDPKTGDRKTHWESREGNKVRGGYTLYEPDGALRTVEYSADSVHGFNAVVKRNESPEYQHRSLHSTFKDHSPVNSVTDLLDSSFKYLPQEKESSANHSREQAKYPGTNKSQDIDISFRVDHTF